MAKKIKRAKRRVIYVPLKKSERKQIREFSKFIPSLEKYKGEARLTPAAYGAFQKAKKKLRHTENLKPVTEKQAKKLKRNLVGGGIRALRLRNVVKGDDHSRVTNVTNKGIVVTSNGRKWEYHPVSSSDIDTLHDRLINYGIKLFHRKTKIPFALHLWTGAGRTNEGAISPEKWIEIVKKFLFGASSAAANNPQEFILGIAALVRESNGKLRKPYTAHYFKNLKTETYEEDEEEE